MWLDISWSGHNLVWCHSCLPDIISNLVLDTNLKGQITNSDLNITAFVLGKATALASVPEACMATPHFESDNTPTIPWITYEASTINPVVADLLRIHALRSRYFFLNPSVFYHPGQKNCMVDDASCLFELSYTSFLIHVSVIYAHLLGLWNIYPSPPEVLSCMISMLHRNPCERAILGMRNIRICISIGQTYVPPCWSIIISKIRPSLISKYSKYMGTGFNTPSTPSSTW